jgi:hypothetical protein
MKKPSLYLSFLAGYHSQIKQQSCRTFASKGIQRVTKNSSTENKTTKTNLHFIKNYDKKY